jgi:HNH endonuclease
MPKTLDPSPSRGRGCARASLRRWSQLQRGRGSAIADAPPCAGGWIIVLSEERNPNSRPPDKTRVAPAASVDACADEGRGELGADHTSRTDATCKDRPGCREEQSIRAVVPGYEVSDDRVARAPVTDAAREQRASSDERRAKSSHSPDHRVASDAEESRAAAAGARERREPASLIREGCLRTSCCGGPSGPSGCAGHHWRRANHGRKRRDRGGVFQDRGSRFHAPPVPKSTSRESATLFWPSGPRNGDPTWATTDMREQPSAERSSAATSWSQRSRPVSSATSTSARRSSSLPSSRCATVRGHAGTSSLANRSMAVKTYVLRRANGCCEACGNQAPFVTLSGRPYLEPHHTRRVSDGRPDHPGWVIALCPTCHRRAHHAADHESFNQTLIAKVNALEGV